MGYYTYYSLKVDSRKDEIIEQLDSSGELSDILDVLEGDNDRKWYEHDEDMSTVSKSFPDVLFELKGEGEESGDIWIKYYRNGKKQICPAKITYDPFDENKLT